MNPQIATTLENGSYGQRQMTDAEYADYLATIAAPEETQNDDQ